VRVRVRSMQIRAFTGGTFAENAYLVTCGQGPQALAIDPGAASSSMVRVLREENLALEAILLTHAHLDHVEGVPALRSVAPDAPIYLHPGDRRMYEGVDAQARAFNLPLVGPLPPPDRDLAHGEVLELAGCRFEVRFAPGHAPGHVIFYSRDEGLAFVGDVVFQGAIGRADLVGGNFSQLMDSIGSQILTLSDETRLYTGHGPETTVGWERRTNPFLVGQFEDEPV
jgi:hydroxyacylglutathione hydrolase